MVGKKYGSWVWVLGLFFVAATEGRAQETVMHDATLTAAERKTDSVAAEIVRLINLKRDDSVYLMAAASFKAKIEEARWKQVAETAIYPLLPLPQPVFMASKAAVRKYRLGAVVILVGLNEEGKFSTFLIQPYREEAKKEEWVASDNPLKTPLDSLADSFFRSYIQVKGTMALSAGVYYKGKTRFYNYGETGKIVRPFHLLNGQTGAGDYQTAEGNGRLPTEHSLYDIGSITKTFTTTLLAMAVSEGKVQLSTPITAFLPDSVASNKHLAGISFKTLANHTSGLPRMPDNLLAAVTHAHQPYEHYGANELFSFLRRVETARPPEKEFEYSNLGMALLGVLLEQIYDKPYKTLVTEYILKPAGLHETYFSVSGADTALLVQGHDEEHLPVPPWEFKVFEAAGVLKSSSHDLLHYAMLQLHTTDPGMKKAIKLAQQTTYEWDGLLLGLGWFRMKENSSVLSHGGATGGYRSGLFVDLDKDLAVVVLANTTDSPETAGLRLLQALQQWADD